MGKQGPCCHCGITSTPLWRNGPPEKPVLCNACGSRWRTKGSLANYTPLHARAEAHDYEDHRGTRVKTILPRKKEQKPNKRKLNYENSIDEGFVSDFQDFQKNLDEDTSNRSSSGSAASNAESCAQFGSADASDLTGPAQSIVWDTLPSRKRTCVNRPKSSAVEKLTKDLYTILHEQQSSHFSESSEDLLFESDTPMVSVEFGHGSVLIRHPSSFAREEESEASSLSVDNNKVYVANDAYSRSASLYALKDSKSVNISPPEVAKVKKLNGQMMQLEPVKRDKTNYEKLHLLWSHNSPLCHIDLTEVLNFEVFGSCLSADEQQHLLKYLPSVDTSVLPYSLMSMFAAPYFKENLLSVQKLLAEGAFDSSFLGAKPEDCKILKRLALSSATKSKWVQQYHILKDGRYKDGPDARVGSSMAKTGISNNLPIAKRLYDRQNHPIPEPKTKIKNHKEPLTKNKYTIKEHSQDERSCLEPRTLLALPNENTSPNYFCIENSDQDLLLDIPSNSSFPQAELLHPLSSFTSQQASASSSSIHPALIR